VQRAVAPTARRMNAIDNPRLVLRGEPMASTRWAQRGRLPLPIIGLSGQCVGSSIPNLAALARLSLIVSFREPLINAVARL
jgi:hypothetical protein